ncbi:hypothetical protein E6Q11_06255 [Candidatus Dojkabacteria bacterium]|uniref:DUF2634 domain-containing protein n=1 Tax=Candidatus Dojkabacteria bacterium TaxID=2099670 RepID=A0A5C7J4Q4_9BACT|nr:MAG: hypothetical protein E6Q11_06255 [Candidatus Dojkabacteria bacterium]
MMDFLLKDRDICIAGGDIELCSDDKEAIAQAITIRLKTMAGEWFLDSNRGLPYLSDIFGHKRSEKFIRHLIVPEIEAIPGVQGIKDFKAQVTQERRMTMSFTASLGDGSAIPINESIGI